MTKTNLTAIKDETANIKDKTDKIADIETKVNAMKGKIEELEGLVGTHDNLDHDKDTGIYKAIYENFTELMGS